MDLFTVLGLISGAAIAGFVNGFAGFGTALFASGIWFLVLPFDLVPPLIVLSATLGQVIGLIQLRKNLALGKAKPLIIGGVFGVPVGTCLLLLVSPVWIKAGVALLLVSYAAWHLFGEMPGKQSSQATPLKDRAVGFFAGILGGLSGLSGPLPIIWGQIQNLSAADQRARYQPFNLAILSLSVLSMSIFGVLTVEVLQLSLITLPTTVVATVLGVWAFKQTSDRTFQTWILRLLLASGLGLLAQIAF